MANSVQILKVNSWHEQLATYMVAHPTSTLAEAAAFFKVSPSYISIVRNSDAFKAYYKDRMDGLFHSTCGEIYGQTTAMTSIALEKLNRKLETIGDTLSVGELKEIADTGLKRLGFGADKRSPAPSVNINVGVVVSRDDLEKARRKMAEVHGVGSSVKQLAAPQDVSTPSQE